MLKIQSSNGLARAGELKVNGIILKTPAIIPVLAFYCGASEKYNFGGGIYKYIKLHINEFDAVLGNVTNFLDFHYNQDKVDYVMKKTIKDWFNYKGLLFIDSGGYKFYTQKTKKVSYNKLIGHGGFCLEGSPYTILNYQVGMGADIAMTLDFPIGLLKNRAEIKKRIKRSSEYANIAKNAIRNNGYSLKLYAAIHGHETDDIIYCVEQLQDGFDGYAIGSLVPLKNNYKKLIDIVYSVKKIIPPDKPLHVFGITGSMIPILSFLGVDTFDSATYVHAGRFGQYYLPNFKKININSIDKLNCTCPICKNNSIDAFRHKGSESASLIAMHNYYVMKYNTEIIQQAICSNNLEEMIYQNFVDNNRILKAFEYAKIKVKEDIT